MQTLINGPRMLYAAIEARYTDGVAERFVIAYTCEASLRELLAAASIVASGSPTREHAEEICRGETLGCDRSQGRLGYGFDLNALRRFAPRYALFLTGITDSCSRFLSYLGAGFRRIGCLSTRPLEKGSLIASGTPGHMRTV